MFEEIRRALKDLIDGNVAPSDRRAALSDMRDTLVHARMGLDDLRKAVGITKQRLASERAELETVQRRLAQAESIGDMDTVAVARRYEAQHTERVLLLGQRLEVEQGELGLVEREVDEMMVQLKAANAGVGSGLGSGAADRATMPDDVLDEDVQLNRELDHMRRAQQRASKEASADEHLAELKRRMGK